MLEVTCGLGASLSCKTPDVHSPSDKNEIKTLFHLVKIRDKQKLISNLHEYSHVYNPGDINEYGETPLMVACKHKKPANAFTLLDFYEEMALPEFISCDGYSPLYYSLNSLNLFKRLLRYQSVLDSLDYVYPCGDNILTLLLNREKENRDEYLSELDEYLSSFLSNEIIECVNILIDNSSLKGLNHRGKDGKTPLILLIEIGEYSIARKLILNGVNTQYYDDDGYSAVSYLTYDLKRNLSRERVELCLLCFEQDESESSEFKEYTYGDFKCMGDVKMGNVISSYGDLKWAIDENDQVKVIKVYKSYSDNKLISDDLVKEIIFIKTLNNDDVNVVKILGTYLDDKNNLHLVFEPLAITLREYFNMLNLYSTIDNKCAIMARMRIETAHRKLRKSLDIIHNFGYFHNDIKLNNMMVGYDGQVRYIDFGISNFIGFSPYERIINRYDTTSNIKAPDYGKPITINFVSKVGSCEYKIYRSGIFNTSRKSYNSDVYSLSVSFIQGILGNGRRYLSFEDNLYEVRNLHNKGDNKGHKDFEDKIDLVKIPDDDLEKLSNYHFFESIKLGVSIDSNLRVKTNVTSKPVSEISDVRSNICLLKNRIKHYNPFELSSLKYELSKYESIFDKYKLAKINIKSSKNYNVITSTFNKILSLVDGKFNIDTYYNAIYRSINYSGSFDIKIVCITYFYLFSHIFEVKSPNIELIAETFDIDFDILVGNVNALMKDMLPNIEIIPFVLIVENMVIKLQLSGVNRNLISDIEMNVFSNLLKYVSGDVPNDLHGKEIYLWDFVQCFSYTVCSYAPFEISYESETILEVFSQF